MRFHLLAAALTVVIGSGFTTVQAQNVPLDTVDVININLTSGAGDNPNVSVNGVSGVGTPLPASGTVFNEINGAPVFGDLLDSLGDATGISVATDFGNTSNFSFSQAAHPNPIFQNYYAGNIGFGASPAEPITITFSGLIPGSAWELALIGQGDVDGQGATVTAGGTTIISLGSDANGDFLANTPDEMDVDPPLLDGNGNVVTEEFTQGVNVALFLEDDMNELIASPDGEIIIDVGPGPDVAGFIAIAGLQLSPLGVEVIPVCDVNVNGVCNTTDFEIIRDNLFQFGDGIDATRADGDLNGDLNVDFADYRIFKDDLDRVIGVDAANALVAGLAVPEPSALILLASCSLAGLARSRRR